MRETEILGRIWCCKQRAYGLTTTTVRARKRLVHILRYSSARACASVSRNLHHDERCGGIGILRADVHSLGMLEWKVFNPIQSALSLWYNGAHFRTTAAMKLAAGILTCVRTLVQKVPSFTDGRRRLNEKQSFITAPTLQRSA